MRSTVVALALAAGVAGGYQTVAAQTGGAPKPFKLGTFERGGKEFVGIVVNNDTQVVDLAGRRGARCGPFPRQ